MSDWQQLGKRCGGADHLWLTCCIKRGRCQCKRRRRAWRDRIWSGTLIGANLEEPEYERANEHNAQGNKTAQPRHRAGFDCRPALWLGLLMCQQKFFLPGTRAVDGERLNGIIRR